MGMARISTSSRLGFFWTGMLQIATMGMARISISSRLGFFWTGMLQISTIGMARISTSSRLGFLDWHASDFHHGHGPDFHQQQEGMPML